MSLEKTNTTEEELILKNLEQVFMLARIQTVTTRPEDKSGLINLINFEAQLVERINKCTQCKTD
tara:strand:- start:62 stop:253 length:192 start_codon:yes stop_codon:yes gene_type:complete